MGCLFYNSPFVQYRWCLAGVSPAPCPSSYTVHCAQQNKHHCHPWINIFYNGTMHHILGFIPSILFLPPIASDCHVYIQYHSQRTLEQVDHIIHLFRPYYFIKTSALSFERTSAIQYRRSVGTCGAASFGLKPTCRQNRYHNESIVTTILCNRF
eukprot:967836_1